MKILQISAYYSGGGAEKVMRQLYNGYKNDKEIECFCMAGRAWPGTPAEVPQIYKGFIERAWTYLKGNLRYHTLYRSRKAKKEIIRFVKEHQIDLIHFHNLHGSYIGLKDLEDIRKVCPKIVITLHDMWCLTGVCPYSFECIKWKQNGCGKCSGNGGDIKKAPGAGKILNEKARIFDEKNMYFVTPSKWLFDCVKESHLRKENIVLIHNGIDIHKYVCYEKEKIRKLYEIPQDKRVILFAANGLNNPYKGFSYLKTALLSLKEKEKYVLLIVGNKEKEDLDLPFQIFDFGYISDEKKMNQLYSAADLFILPSMADNLPFTAIESMASGTPVVAFETGGIPEILDDAGWLVKRGDSIMMRKKIEEIFENPDLLRKKAEECRSYVEKNFLEQDMLHKYKKLYLSI